MEEFPGLNPEQCEKLARPLDPKRVKHRQGGGGTQLAYIEGHDAIDTANAIFGYGGWGVETLSNEYINVFDEKGDAVGGYYAARVKLTVSGCVPIIEEGVCAVSEGRNPRAKVDAHDMSRKGAITDAMKRCLRMYGDQFGNSLYDKDLVDGQPRPEIKPKVVVTRSGQPTSVTIPTQTTADPAVITPRWGRDLTELTAHYTGLFKSATTTDKVKALWLEAEKICQERGIPQEAIEKNIKSISLNRYYELAAPKPVAAVN